MPHATAAPQHPPLESQMEHFFTNTYFDAETTALLQAYLNSPGPSEAVSCARELARHAQATHEPDHSTPLWGVYDSILCTAQYLPQMMNALVELIAAFNAAADEARAAGSDLVSILCGDQLWTLAVVINDAWRDHMAWTQRDRGERYACCEQLQVFLARLWARGLVPFGCVDTPLTDVLAYAALKKQYWNAATKTYETCDPETHFLEELDQNDPDAHGVNIESVDFAIPLAARWMVEVGGLLWKKRTEYPEHEHKEEDRRYNKNMFLREETGRLERCFCVQSWERWKEGFAGIAMCPQVMEKTRRAAEEALAAMRAAELEDSGLSENVTTTTALVASR